MKLKQKTKLQCCSCKHIFEQKDIVYKPPLSNFAVIGCSPNNKGYESCPKCGDIAFMGWKKLEG